jgi:hypothetical protein
VHEAGDGLCGVFLESGKHVAVDVQREAHRGVAKPLRDNLRVHAGLQRERRPRVPQVVQADALQAGVPGAQREPRATRGRDVQDRVEANLDDYAAVRALVEPLIAAGVDSSVKPETRQTVEAVVRLSEAPSGTLLNDPSPVTQAQIAKELRLDKSAVHRRVRDALGLGYLRDLDPQRGRQSRIVVGEPLPEGTAVLPPVDVLASAWSPGGGVGSETASTVQPPRARA